MSCKNEKPICDKCVFVHLRGCPVMGSLHNAACLTLYKNKYECDEEKCKICKLEKYCKRNGYPTLKFGKEKFKKRLY